MKLRFVIHSLVLALIAATPTIAQEDTSPPGKDDGMVETIEVKRTKQKGPKHESLQFLKDNRVFLRSQLDRLSLQITRERSDEADMLDARYLMLKEMSAAIAAASDTIRSEHDSTLSRGLLQSVTELSELEAELSLMEQLLAEQSARLLALEQDFLGHQETALVIIIKGLNGRDTPESIVISEDEEHVTVELTPSQRASLAQGGIAQVYHHFVEPRDHLIIVRFNGDAWTQSKPVPISIEAARDRITFFEMDLSQLDPNHETAGILTNVWYR